MEGKEPGEAKLGTGGAYNWSLSREMRTGMHYEHCGAINGVLACNKIEIDWKRKKGLGNPQSPKTAG